MSDSDYILNAFLENQHSEAMALAENSDVLSLYLASHSSLQYYLAEFNCPCLVKQDNGDITTVAKAVVGIWLPSNHLREFDTAKVVSWLEPISVFHPNIKPPFMCLGHLPPGASMKEILHQIYAVITYQKVTMTELDALNHEACEWARKHQERFPLYSRPLTRQTLTFDAEPLLGMSNGDEQP